MDRETAKLWDEIERLKKRISGVWDQVYEQYGSWHDWTPTVTQGVAVTVSPIFCRYARIGSTAILQARLYVSTAGVAGNAISIGNIPAAVQPANVPCTVGTAMILQLGVQWHQGALYSESASALKIQTDGTVGALGAAPSFALNLYHQIWFNAVYER